MKLLERKECESLLAKIERVKNGRQPRAIAYYNSRLRNADEVARNIVSTVQPMKQATLICVDTIFGDRLQEGHPDWKAYYAWRTRLGGFGNLYDFPGHHFEADEAGDLAACVSLTFLLGWDAVMSVLPSKNILEFSHDDRIEIYRGFNHRDLLPRLVKLGFQSA